MSWTNFHSHCGFCDGKGKLDDHAREAINQGFTSFGFSSHAPLPFYEPWSMKLSDLYEYVGQAKGLKSRYFDQIQLYMGLEIDFVPQEISPNMQIFDELNLDYTIGSVHFVDRMEDGKHWEIDGQRSVFNKGMEEIFGNDSRKFIQRYFDLVCQMVEISSPDIVGHLDKFKIHNQNQEWYSESDTWYVKAIEETLEVIKHNDSIVEVNTRGLYKGISSEPYPSYWVLKRCHEEGIPITLSSDSHRTEEISSQFETVSEFLQEIGFREFRVLYNGEWQDKPFDNQGITLTKFV